MNFFKTDADVKAGKTLEERAQYVRRGGSLTIFRPADVTELQTYAMDIKDVQLYNYLDQFWAGRKPVKGVQS